MRLGALVPVCSLKRELRVPVDVKLGATEMLPGRGARFTEHEGTQTSIALLINGFEQQLNGGCVDGFSHGAFQHSYFALRRWNGSLSRWRAWR